MLIVHKCCDRDHMTRNGIVYLDCWLTKILPLFGGFVHFDFYPLGILSYGAFVHFPFLCAPTWCWLSTPVVIVITWPEMGFYTLIVGVLKYCLFLGFCPLWFLSFGAFLLWCFCPLGFSLCAHVMLIVLTCCDHDHMTRNGIVHLGCWRTKILPLLGVLSALIFILWGFCPNVLLSIGAFLCAPTWWWFSTPVSHDHMTRNGIVHLDCWRTKILPLLGVLTALIFTLWSFCPMVLLSIMAFLCAPRWCWLSTLVVIVITWPEMGLYTLLVGVLKYCLFWGFCLLLFLSFGAFVLW